MMIILQYNSVFYDDYHHLFFGLLAALGLFVSFCSAIPWPLLLLKPINSSTKTFQDTLRKLTDLLQRKHDQVKKTKGLSLPSLQNPFSKLQRKKKEERKHQPGKMCGRYTLLIANSLLALLGLLLLAGGVWRIVDDQSLRDVANELRDTAEWDNVAKEVTGLDDAVKEAAGHKYFNYALLGMGGITLLVALFGFCGAKKENQCLLSLYTICVFIILLLQIAAIVFINVDDANINFINDSISSEAEKVDIHIEKPKPGSKFVQNLFFGVSAGLSGIILFFTLTLCCRARREERVQGYVDAIQA